MSRLHADLCLENDHLLEKVNHLESVVSDLEEKNKRLGDLISNTMYSKAQNYKETVLNRLSNRDQFSPEPRNNHPNEPTNFPTNRDGMIIDDHG